MRSTGWTRNRLLYVLLLIPVVASFASWMGFPILADFLTTAVFRYENLQEPAPLWWIIASTVFYSWFTFLTIGIGGMLSIGSWLSKRKVRTAKLDFYPMVSFVVPAFNEEKQLPRCLNSIYRCIEKYPGPAEVIVVDDGSTDSTYEIAFASIHLNSKKFPSIRSRAVRHMANLGKVEALRSGVNRSLGQLVAVIDADSSWSPETLKNLVEYMKENGKSAVTGYIHPEDGEQEGNPYVVLQQLEYSQGLGVFRCAQALGNAVLIVPGAIGLFDAEVLRGLLNNHSMKSVTEDLEITLKLHTQGHDVGYMNAGRCGTVAPKSFASFWNQRSRWFGGWLHNVFGIHRDVLSKRRWLSLLLWYILLFEYFGAFLELVAITGFPFLFWFAPDRVLFVINLLWFAAYCLLCWVLLQAIALRFAYGEYNHSWLLCYTPFYAILRFLNLVARVLTTLRYSLGYRGNWENRETVEVFKV